MSRRKKRAKNTYLVYKRLYKQAKERMNKAGFDMFDKKGMFSKQEFYDEYRSMALKNKELPKSKQSKNITRDIVASQTYSKTQSYAKSLRDAVYKYYMVEEKEYGIKGYAKKKLKENKITIHNIRLGVYNLDVLSDEYWWLKDHGYSSEEAAEEIAGEYFGS